MDKDRFSRVRLRFYHPPSPEDNAAAGSPLIAEIRVRTRARIIGTCALGTTIVLVSGTGLTLYDALSTQSPASIADTIANYAVPATVNLIAQIKVERQLHQASQEIERLVADLPPQDE